MIPSVESGVAVGVLSKMTRPRSAVLFIGAAALRRAYNHAPSAEPMTLARIPYVRVLIRPPNLIGETQCECHLSASRQARPSRGQLIGARTSIPINCINRSALRDVAIPSRSR